jgi:hypothetical protein
VEGGGIEGREALEGKVGGDGGREEEEGMAGIRAEQDCAAGSVSRGRYSPHKRAGVCCLVFSCWGAGLSVRACDADATQRPSREGHVRASIDVVLREDR